MIDTKGDRIPVMDIPLFPTPRDEETPRAHVGNALQILKAVQPYEVSPNEVVELLTDVEARLMKAITRMDADAKQAREYRAALTEKRRVR